MPWLALILLTLAGCNWTQTQANQTQDTPVPVSIDCHLAYRSSVTVGIEREETLSFSTGDDTQTVTFPQLKFQAKFWAGASPPGERALRVSVSPSAGDAELVAQLYQLSQTEALQNQFVG